ncbi:MAG: type II secretion system protein M [Sedimentisphaerales bacterium]|nr:type II secretion system protein M [Sedimentisphaerales bacterium]
MVTLTKRERFLAMGLAAVAGTLGLYAMIIRPTYHRIQTLERIIPDRQAELHMLEAKSVEYLALCNEFESFRARASAQDPNFELLPYLETLTAKHGLKHNVVAMAPDALPLQGDYSATVVRLELDGVGMKQLVAFLKEIDTSEPCVHLGSVRIRKNLTDDALLDSTVEIRGPQPGQQPLAFDTSAPS